MTKIFNWYKDIKEKKKKRYLDQQANQLRELDKRPRVRIYLVDNTTREYFGEIEDVEQLFADKSNSIELESGEVLHSNAVRSYQLMSTSEIVDEFKDMFNFWYNLEK